MYDNPNDEVEHENVEQEFEDEIEEEKEEENYAKKHQYRDLRLTNPHVRGQDPDVDRRFWNHTQHKIMNK